MASMRDIAKLAGVSVASVSRILNNDETFSINENTRKRVIEIANQRGPIFQGLVQGIVEAL